MAKLVAISLQKLSPFTSEYTKDEITSDGEIQKQRIPLALHILA